MAYESLMLEYPQLEIMESSDLPKGLAGLYYDNVILLDKHRNTYEKYCILAEEIGHYETTYGDISDLSKIQNLKLEVIARRWSYKKLAPLQKLIECYDNHYTTMEDICHHLAITPEFLQDILEFYKDKNGLSVEYKGYKIEFDPLNISKL